MLEDQNPKTKRIISSAINGSVDDNGIIQEISITECTTEGTIITSYQMAEGGVYKICPTEDPAAQRQEGEEEREAQFLTAESLKLMCEYFVYKNKPDNIKILGVPKVEIAGVVKDEALTTTLDRNIERLGGNNIQLDKGDNNANLTRNISLQPGIKR